MQTWIDCPVDWQQLSCSKYTMPTFVLKNSDSESEPSIPEFIKDVNDKQREAVLHTDGPLLIIAGAGSGKTRVLTYRIANLISRKKAWASQILALTFTNKAAREMQERIADLIGEQANRLWMGTFHSIFSRILRMEAEHLGYSRDFSIYDTVDSDRVIKTILQELGFNTREIKPQTIRFVISNAKNQMITPEDFRNNFVQGSMDDIAAQVYHRYVLRCKKNNAMDFDDLLIKPIELFEKFPDILDKYRNHFRYILIDEYQDTNHAQYKVTRLLADGHKNICVVGDDSQSIYSFRGADISNILNFRRDYPDSVQIPLEQNYRSTKAILMCADAVIKNNVSRLEKTLWTDNDRGESITVLENYDERDEANRIARKVEELKLRHHLNYRDFAILYRTNYQSRVFEDALRRRGITYQLVGGISFYQRKEVKDVIAYLRLMANPHDDESLLRIINEPNRGVGQKSLNELMKSAQKEETSLWEILKNVESVPVYKPAIPKIQAFVDMMEAASKKLQSSGLTDTVRFLMEETGYVRQFLEEHSHESLMRRQNVSELLNAISYYEKSAEEPSLSSFLQEISLVTDLDAHDNKEPAVTLMTVHGSKGLEFPVVFIAGLEEELFPIGGRTGDDVDFEEERRLFYVAITRAEKYLYLSHAKNRYRFGEQMEMRASRFLDEVDPSVVRTETGASYRQKHSRNSAGSTFMRNNTSGSTYISYDNRPFDSDLNESGFIDKQTESADNFSIEYDSEPRDKTWRPGLVVMHPKFGPGKVIQCEGSGDDARLTIFFKNYGQKKLVAKYAKLNVIG